MGKHIVRQIPKGMPSLEKVQKNIQRLQKPYILAGSRGDRTSQNKTPKYEVHGQYRIINGSVNNFRNKNVIIFIHGFNNTTDEALKESNKFFDKLATSLTREPNSDLNKVAFCSFTWPGDTGTIYFSDGQAYAHISGVALFNFISDIYREGIESCTLVSHSLGAHVVLRALSIVANRRFNNHIDYRIDSTLLLGAAVEDDVFRNPENDEEYHFPESAFATKYLHIVTSIEDDVLSKAFYLNEKDKALGHRGPQSMSPLKSLAGRVETVLGADEVFKFQVHNFSPKSASILNPKLHVTSHGGYWANQEQMNYYLNYMTLL